MLPAPVDSEDLSQIHPSLLHRGRGEAEGHEGTNPQMPKFPEVQEGEVSDSGDVASESTFAKGVGPFMY